MTTIKTVTRQREQHSSPLRPMLDGAKAESIEKAVGDTLEDGEREELLRFKNEYAMTLSAAAAIGRALALPRGRPTKLKENASSPLAHRGASAKP